MDDPLSPLHDRPPRYLLESDSSDEEGQGIYPGSSSTPSGSSSRPKSNSRGIKPAPKASLEWKKKDQEHVERVVLGVGQAGKYLLRKMGFSPSAAARAKKSAREEVDADLEVKLAGRIIGQGWLRDGTLILGVMEGMEEQDVLYGLANELISGLPAKFWTILTTYLPSLYIPDKPSSSPVPPIRYLSIKDGKSVPLKATPLDCEALTSPNYVTGLEAALLSQLVHPQSPSTSSTLLLLPLPLSSLSPSSFSETLTAVIPGPSLPASSQGATTGWDEDDDEPYVQAGMGLGSGKRNGGRGVVENKREVEGMYM